SINKSEEKLISYLRDAQNFTQEHTQKADEIFITNTLAGIRPISKYRKKEYNARVAGKLLPRLNALARLG
ncbi:MAG: aminotransferase class IV, partial [Marinirhabdus sp.]